MNRIAVISSNIASIGYDNLNQVLEVAFLSGHVVQYFGVDKFTYESLMNADSKGSYLAHFIKNRYQFKYV